MTHDSGIEETHNSGTRSIGDAIAAISLLIPVLFYQILYYRSYFPITEGWFSTYAHLIRIGKIPYTDFYFLLPPLYPLHIALAQVIFGDEIIALRVIGLVITAGIEIVLFCILKRVFNRWIAAFTAAVGVIYYQSGNAYLGYDFTQFLTLYALLGTYFLLLYIDDRSDGERYGKSKLFLLLSGVFFASAALVKQSNGGVISVGITLWLCIFAFRAHPPRRAIAHLS